MFTCPTGCGAESLTTHTTSYQASEVCSQCYDLNDFEFIEYILNNDEKIVDDLQEQMNKSSKRIQELETQLELEHKQQEKLEEEIKLAIKKNNLVCLKYLIETAHCGEKIQSNGIIKLPKDILEYTVHWRSWDCMKYLIEKGGVFWTNECGNIICGKDNWFDVWFGVSPPTPLDVVIYAYENGCPFDLESLTYAFLSGFVEAIEFLTTKDTFNLYDLLQEAIKSCAYERSQVKPFIISFKWLAKNVYGPWNNSLLTPIIIGIVKNDLLDDDFFRWLAFDSDKRFWVHSIGKQYIEKIIKKQIEIEVLKNNSIFLYTRKNLPKAVIKYELFSYF